MKITQLEDRSRGTIPATPLQETPAPSPWVEWRAMIVPALLVMLAACFVLALNFKHHDSAAGNTAQVPHNPGIAALSGERTGE